MRRYLSIVGALVLVASACSQAPTGTTTTTQSAAPATAAAQPVRGGRVVTGSISDVKTFLSVIATDSASLDQTGWLYLGLTRSNPDTGDQEGLLAEKFSVSPDGRKVTYTLRPNLVWSDGQPFTMEDYKYTAEAVARSKASPDKSQFADITGWKDYVDGKADEVAGIKVTDGGRSVEVSFDKVNCVAVRNVASAGRGILPKHHFVKDWNNKTLDKDKVIDTHPLANKPPASMGPFTFKEHQSGVQTILVANDKYFKGRPNIDEFITKVYADQVAIKAALLTGEVTYSSSIQPLDVEEVQNAGKEVLALHRLRGVGSYNFLGWNLASAKAPWLADKRVRQALTFGIDVKTIVDKVLVGWGHQVYAHIPQASAFYDGTGLNSYPYDVNKAKSLLESAGAKMGADGIYRWTDGKPMQFRIETNQGNKVRETILEVAQEQYKKIGLKIDPLLESFPALLDRTDCCNPDFEGFILGWGGIAGDPDSAAMGIWHSQNIKKGGFNFISYKNPELDKVLEQASRGPDCSFETRKKLYAQYSKTLNDDVPYTFLFTQDAPFFVNKVLKGVEPKTYSTIWNIEQWYIKR